MDTSSARMFLESLLERIVIDPVTGKRSLPGTVSAHEISALQMALQMLGGHVSSQPPLLIDETEIQSVSETEGEKEVSSRGNGDDIVKVELSLNLKSLNIKSPENDDVILCLDFGTAMSKAFATIIEDGEVVDNLPLKLGRRGASGGQFYPVPSSLWITNDGEIYFGEHALALSLQDSTGGRQRFDSLKKELIMGLVEVSPDKVPLSPEINPTTVLFSKGDAITLFLGYLTDLACSELEERHKVSRYVFRRFALPSWEERRRDWGEKMLAKMLAKAQIIADTFHGRWEEGISMVEVRSALDQVNNLADLPTYLVGEGVTEPLAAGTSRLRQEEAVRGLAMVIDIGAGTSDFAMFVVSEDPAKEIFKAWPIEGCNESLHQAGDTLDNALLQAILEKARVDSSNPDFPFVMANLRMNLRTLKEQLFTEELCTYNLSNGDRGIIELDEFLERPAVIKFAEHLSLTFQRVVDKANKSILARFEGSSLTVVLTGGGATLPMVTELSEGACRAHGITLYRSQAPLVPDEFSDDDELSFIYPQLAVAIGGASPNLIDERNAISDMPGLAEQKWTLGRVQVSGV